MNSHAAPHRLKLALGPLLYYWKRERVLAFYREIAASPVDTVYLGEVVCSRRHETRFEDWLAIADELAAAGKEAVLSAQAITEGEGDLKLMRRLAGNGRLRVEANDMGAVRMLAERPGWIAGPHLNIYNPRTLELFAGLGATRWVAPVEISREMLAGVLAERPAGLEVEVFAHGRLPLAFSARCFTARRFNLQKENCGFRCIEHPDGLALETREGEAFLALNGVQTQSAQVYSLAGDIEAVRALGIDMLRVSPQSSGTREVLAILRAAADGVVDAGTALHDLAPLAPGKLVDGFWHGRAAHEHAAVAARRAEA
jgi:collagenase-like PrtC family protease